MDERSTSSRPQVDVATHERARSARRLPARARGPRGDRPRWAGAAQRAMLAADGRDRWLPAALRLLLLAAAAAAVAGAAAAVLGAGWESVLAAFGAAGGLVTLVVVLAAARGADVLAAVVSIAAAAGTVALTVAAGEEPGPAAVGLLGAALAYPVWRVTGRGSRPRMGRVVAVSGLQLLLVASTGVGLRLAVSGHLAGAVGVVVASVVLPGVGWLLAGGVLVDVRGRLAGYTIDLDVPPAAPAGRLPGRLTSQRWTQVVGQAAAEEATGRVLVELGRSWTVLHDRQLPDGQVVAHLLIGPPGLVVVQSSLWSGVIGAQLWLTEDGDVASRYHVDGDQRLVQDVAGVAAAAGRAVRVAAVGGWPVPVHAAVVVHAAGLPAAWVTVDVDDDDEQVGAGERDPASTPVTVVGPRQLRVWLTGLRAAAPPAARLPRVVVAVARVCDRAFPPVR